MATTASPLAPTVVAGPSGSSPSSSRDTQRASRPSHTRPTTYSGVPPTATIGSPGYQSSPSPVTIPPRTSSQRQVPGMSSNPEPRAERSRSTSERVPVSGDSRRGDRDRDRERDREREQKERERDTEGGRTRRAPTAATAAPVAASDAPQRRNSSSHRDDSRKTTNGTSNSNQTNGTRSEGTPSRTNGTSRTAPEGERRDGRGRKETRFGDYILGQTLGEGEFGKVKLGWRRDGGVQVTEICSHVMIV